MRYLITGGAGFIGSHVLGHIKKINHSCIVLDNFSTGVHRTFQAKSRYMNVIFAIMEWKSC